MQRIPRASTSLLRALTTPSSAALRPHAPSPASPKPIPSTPIPKATNTISPAEIAHFTSLAQHWWDPTGEFMLLHRMNPARIKFIKESLLRIEEVSEGSRWLEGRTVLDVGCGGGIFSEALARVGATTLGIDAAPVNISVAQTHASFDPSFPLPANFLAASTSASSNSNAPRPNQLEYRHVAAEELVKEEKQFDIVCCMEVIEHVEDPKGFLDCLTDLTKPGGLLLMSTISRTPLAQLLTITMAEDVLRLVTSGTHTYSKFVKPDELQAYFESRGWKDMERRGCIYDPLSGSWKLLGMGTFGGAGEQCNFFAGIRKPM